jgi:hypothetical protein
VAQSNVFPSHEMIATNISRGTDIHQHHIKP